MFTRDVEINYWEFLDFICDLIWDLQLYLEFGDLIWYFEIHLGSWDSLRSLGFEMEFWNLFEILVFVWISGLTRDF